MESLSLPLSAPWSDLTFPANYFWAINTYVGLFLFYLYIFFFISGAINWYIYDIKLQTWSKFCVNYVWLKTNQNNKNNNMNIILNVLFKSLILCLNDTLITEFEVEMERTIFWNEDYMNDFYFCSFNPQFVSVVNLVWKFWQGLTIFTKENLMMQSRHVITHKITIKVLMTKFQLNNAI